MMPKAMHAGMGHQGYRQSGVFNRVCFSKRCGSGDTLNVRHAGSGVSATADGVAAAESTEHISLLAVSVGAGSSGTPEVQKRYW